MPPILSVGLAAGWLWLMTAAGDALLEWLRFEPSSQAERLAFAVGLGTGATGTALLALGSIGGFRPLVLLALVVAAVVLLRRHLVGVGRALRAVVKEVAAELRARPEGWLAVVTSGVLLGATLVLAVAPVTDWDSLMYHLRIPAEFLARGRIYLPADNLHVTMTGLVHLLYLVPLAAHDASAAAVLSVGFACALGLAIYAFCARAFTARTGLFAVTAYWGMAMLLLVASTPRVDVQVTFYLFLATYLVCFEGDWRTPELVLIGVLLGFALATKLSAGAYLVAVGLAVLALAGPGPWTRIRATAAVTAAATLVALPWLVRNVVLVGAPFYPFLTHRVAEPWIQALAAPGRAPRLSSSHFMWMWTLRPPFNLRDFFLHPGRLSIEGEARDYFASPMLVLLPALALRRRRELLVLTLPALAFLVAVVLAFPQLNLRYLLPGLVPLTVVGAVLADLLLGRPKLRTLWATVLLLAVLPGLVAVRDQLGLTPVVRYATGRMTRHEYLVQDPKSAGLTEADNLTRRVVPDSGLVLMLFEARGYRFPRRALQDDIGTNWAYLVAAGATNNCLVGTGITHVLVNDAALGYYRSSGLDLELVDWERFPSFADRCLKRDGSVGGFTLWSVRPTGRRATASTGGATNPRGVLTQDIGGHVPLMDAPPDSTP